jgi:hypothetical protein
LAYEWFLKTVKDVALAPAPRERDEADRVAAQYFKLHADGTERLLVYNGELHDVTLRADRDGVRHDSEKLRTIIRAGKPMIVFHNHSRNGGRAAMFPTPGDFGVAAQVTFMAHVEDPALQIDFRIAQLGEEEDTIVSYGFKGSALEEIKDAALQYRDAAALGSRLAQEALSDYLLYVCPVEQSGADGDECRTHPEYFLWPSDRFFVHHRPR